MLQIPRMLLTKRKWLNAYNLIKHVNKIVRINTIKVQNLEQYYTNLWFNLDTDNKVKLMKPHKIRPWE